MNTQKIPLTGHEDFRQRTCWHIVDGASDRPWWERLHDGGDLGSVRKVAALEPVGSPATKEVPFDQSMRRTAFDGYFAAVRGMTLHPGTTRDAAPSWTLEQVRDEALRMLDIRDQLVAEGRL